MIELQHVSKTFENAGGRVDALRDVSLDVEEGDEDRMEVGSENTWKKEWNFCR